MQSLSTHHPKEYQLERCEDIDRDSPETIAQRSTRPIMVFILLFAFTRLPETLLLLRLQDLGVAIALVPVMWAALHVVRTVGSYPGGWLSDRLGPRRTMMLGWAFYAFVCVNLALADSRKAGSLWFLCLGGVTMLTEAPERALASAFAPARRGTHFGIYHAGVGLAGLLGGLTFGILYGKVGGDSALITSAILAASLAAGSLVTARCVPKH